MLKIEANFEAILSIPLIAQAVIDVEAAAAAAAASAAAAATAASDAQASADATTSESSLVNSYPTLYIAPLISIDSAGNATIANHSRAYGDATLNPTVAVTGGVIATGASNPDVLRFYYTDPTRAGGAVTYLWTVDPTDPPVQGNNVHSVGAVTVPAAGTSSGNNVRPPGYVEP